ERDRAAIARGSARVLSRPMAQEAAPEASPRHACFPRTPGLAHGARRSLAFGDRLGGLCRADARSLRGESGLARRSSARRSAATPAVAHRDALRTAWKAPRPFGMGFRP